MAKQCPEEFNPWPPFVDIFASTILVLMLFLLITVVNIGYYAQYNFKMAYSGSTESIEVVNNEVASKVKVNFREKQEVTVTEDNAQINSHKMDIPAFDCNKSKGSLFSGGEGDGNAIKYASQKRALEFLKQKIITKKSSIVIEFESKEIFINNQIKQKIRQYVKSTLRRNKKTKFFVYVSDPDMVISSTIAKQISLGRALNIKGFVAKQGVSKKNLRLNLQKDPKERFKFGSVTIEARVP
jgi:hypothetical protein